MNAPRSQVNEEQNVIGDEPRLRPHLRGEEICRRKDVHVRADELVPRRCLFSLRHGRYAVALQYVADGLVAHSVPEVRQRARDAIVAPRSVLSGEADNQLFDFIVDSWSPRVRPVLGTVELPCDELAVPPEDRIGPDDTRYLFERSLAELFSDLGQRSPLTIGQAQTALQLISKNTILGNEVPLRTSSSRSTDPVMHASIVFQSIVSLPGELE